MVVVVVEPGLADGHYRRIGQRRFDARRGVRVPGRGDVGMDAGRGRKSEGVRQFYGTPGGLEGIRDDDDVSHARSPCPPKHLLAVRLERHVRQVAVGVNQHPAVGSAPIVPEASGGGRAGRRLRAAWWHHGPCAECWLTPTATWRTWRS